MSGHKLVLKGTGRMSLHDRFTQLKFRVNSPPPLQPAVQHQPPVHVGGSGRSYGSSSQAMRTPPYVPTKMSHTSGMRAYGYSPSRARTPDLPRYAARRRSLSPIPRSQRSQVSRNRSAGDSWSQSSRNQQTQHKNNYGVKSPTLMANRIKKKSVYLRLGVRPGTSAARERMSSGIPVWARAFTNQQNRFGRKGFARSNSSASLNRWNSQGSINSFDAPRYPTFRRYRGFWGGRGGFRNNRSWRGSSGGGGGGARWRTFGRQRFYGGARQFNRSRGGRGRSARRGAGGAVGGGAQKPAPPNREQLDKELDAYMAATKGVLDNDMDAYMSQKL